MFRKLSEEKLQEIIQTGICFFAKDGASRVSMNQIAKSCGLSVGVLYKYFENKEAFFQACLEESMKSLEAALEQVMEGEAKPLERVEKILRILVSFSKTHPEVIKMYHRISCEEDAKLCKQLAERIESASSSLYSRYIREAQEAGLIRKDLSPGAAAFFFDNLLMMLQFSYSGTYYKERMKLYLGPDCEDMDEMLIGQMMRFFESAFTFDASQIVHSREEGKC